LYQISIQLSGFLYRLSFSVLLWLEKETQTAVCAQMKHFFLFIYIHQSPFIVHFADE